MRTLAMHLCDLLHGVGIILALPGMVIIRLSQLALQALGYREML